MSSPSSIDTGDVLAAIERAMLRIRRSQGRRTVGAMLAERLAEPVELNDVAVVDAVDEASATRGEGVTVRDVAEHIGVDPSHASRLVAAAVRRGYVRRVASQADGRRVELVLAPQGRALAEVVHAVRRELYDQRMQGWSDEDRQRFADLLTRFTADPAHR